MENMQEAAIIYNVTTQVTHTIKDEWVKWMKEKHIPEVMQTGCFLKFQFVKVLELDETEGVTFAVQYFAESKSIYHQYVEKYASALRKDALEKWGNQMASFRSLMQCL
ncbi:MAG: DUF4286 family protein [Chitinophagaceae bacterium]